MPTLWRMMLSLIFPVRPEARIVRATTSDDLRGLLAQKFFGEIHSLLPYRNETVRACVWQLKYRDDARAAELLGSLLHEEMLSRFTSPHLLIPIPLSDIRLRERGYNQVARVAAYALREPSSATLHEDALARKHTERQTKLSRRERLRNLDDVFSVKDAEAVYGADIILLDDVVTTGATLRSARKVLLEAGAKNVSCVALAH